MMTLKPSLPSRGRHYLAAALIAAFLVLPAYPQEQVTLPPGVTKVTSVEGISEYRLGNGLRVLLVPDQTKSNITVNITYMVGSRHEHYGETGMAHLLEHLLFKGTPRHPDIPKELTDRGTRPNGTTWFDRTNYFETFQATEDNLRWALDLEADRMVNSFVAQKDLDSEMTVVRNEFEMGENSPFRVLQQRVFAASYQWHNYGKSTIGARSDIEKVPIDRLQAFYRHFYQPDNAMLVVAGKFDEAKTIGLVHEYFAKIPKPTRELRRTYTAEPVQDGERLVTLRRVGDTQAMMIAYHVPPGSHEEYAAAQLAARILGDVPAGRLHKALVETKKAANVSMGSYQLKEPGLAFVMAEVRTEQPLDEARRVALEVVERIKDKPFTGEELDRVRNQYLKGIELMMNNSEQIAFNLTEWQAMGDWRLLFLHRDRVKNVKLDAVQKAAEKYFISSNRTVGLFIPEKEPLRAEIPEAPDIEALVKDYKGEMTISQGEAFEATPDNIDKRTIRGDLQGGLKLSFISKKTRGEQVVATLNLRFGDEKSLMNKSTVGSMTGAMLMRGTSKHTRQQIRDLFDKYKANVMVSGGVTSAFASVQTTRANLAPVLNLVAEILREASFPADEFEQLKQQRLAGLESQKSEPQALAFTSFQRHLMPYPKGDVRYVPNIEENIELVKAVTLDDVKNFHKEFYGASAGEAVIIGDFDAEAAQKQIAGLFNDWKAPKGFTRVARKYQPIPPKADVIETPDKANAVFIAGMPLQLKDTDPDYPALVLGNYILGGGMGSRLFSRIRGKEGLSYGVSASMSGTPTEDLQMFIGFAISAPENAPKVEASFKDELAQILEKGYTAAEVEAAQKSWMQLRQVSRAQDRELASRLAMHLYFSRTMAFDADLERKVLALTPEQIRDAMRKHIKVDQLSFVKAGDWKKANVTW